MSTTEGYVKMTPQELSDAVDAIYYRIRTLDEDIARWSVLQLVKDIEHLKQQVAWYEAEVRYLTGEDD